MTEAHFPLAQLVGGPADGRVQPCPLLGGFLCDGFMAFASPEGRYELEQTVTHDDDGSLCGGIYRWRRVP